MDLLLDELEQKDQEMADMREKFDEILEYEIMVEEMVQEIANKEGEVEEMTERMIEIEEEHAMLEELVENLETYNKELQDEVADKERDIVNLGQEKEQLETIVIDQDAITSKYKERQAQLSKQIAVLTEQLEITVSTAGNKD
jgi:predicted nuclease with TOPRIM domain